MVYNCKMTSTVKHRFTLSAEPKKKNKTHFGSLPSHFSSMPSIVKISDTEYETGKFIVQNDRRFPLRFKVSVKEGVLEVQIPVPDGYKSTELTNKSKVFGRVTITLNELYIYYIFIHK